MQANSCLQKRLLAISMPVNILLQLPDVILIFNLLESAAIQEMRVAVATLI